MVSDAASHEDCCHRPAHRSSQPALLAQAGHGMVLMEKRQQLFSHTHAPQSQQRVSTEPTDGSRALQIKGLQGNEPYPCFTQLYLERGIGNEVGYVGWKEQPFPPDRTESEMMRKWGQFDGPAWSYLSGGDGGEARISRP